MDVSHFELIWKPQSPNAPTGTAAVASVLQGYFLEITNLEDVAYSYAVDFVAAPVTDPLRSLSGNTLVFVDTPNTNNTAGFLSGAITATTFTPSTGRITIPPKGTALIAVLPSAFGPLPFEPTPLTAPNFEVRGYVRLRLPTEFRRVTTPSGFSFFQQQPQAAGPVKVMLTPQNRATYFAADGSITDQTQASLPLANGNAVSSLPPDQPIRFTFTLGDLSAQSRAIERIQDLLGADEMMLATSALLASLAEDDGTLSRANAALAESGIGLALERRKLKS